MNKAELRALRIQLLLIGGIFAGSTVLALVVVLNRPWFERYVQEKYRALPAVAQTAQRQSPLHLAAAAAADGHVDEDTFSRLTEQQSLLLYDHWMTRDSPPTGAPLVLTRANSSLYLARAERTLVCGTAEQRVRALRFLELSAHPDALPILDKYRHWARRYKDPDLMAHIDETAERIRRAVAAGSNEASFSSEPVSVLPSNEGEPR